jgi:hypothetical protein
MKKTKLKDESAVEGAMPLGQLFDLTMNPGSAAGSLREILVAACEESGRSMKELTVLKDHGFPGVFSRWENVKLEVAIHASCGPGR